MDPSSPALSIVRSSLAAVSGHAGLEVHCSDESQEQVGFRLKCTKKLRRGVECKHQFSHFCYDLNVGGLAVAFGWTTNQKVWRNSKLWENINWLDMMLCQRTFGDTAMLVRLHRALGLSLPRGVDVLVMAFIVGPSRSSSVQKLSDDVDRAGSSQGW
jgi:hypothetical protein